MLVAPLGRFYVYLYYRICVLIFQYTSGIFLNMEINPIKLKELREAKGFSVRSLAREAGVSTETVYSLEHGRRQPTITTLSKLAGALGVEVKDFFA